MKIKAPKKNQIELLGMFGEFNAPNSNYTIKYFSTYANNREDNSYYNLLLKELKPMRERTDPSQIKDLRSLLQRDLNDYRVANELIPYLLNRVDNKESDKHIAFFPAILCVLFPTNFINSTETIKYPVPNKMKYIKENQSYVQSYENMWECEYFTSEAEGNSEPARVNLGKLKINLGKSDITVIDGQHRANAFRVIADSFDLTGHNSIYSTFYRFDKLEKLDADLPVTLVWFESNDLDKTPVEPDLISRKLFVDVNQSSKSISESRLVLLNDSKPSSLFTRYFYSYLANINQFKSDEFSLLHAGFDFDENLRDRKTPHQLTLILPEIIDYAFDWLFFGSSNYSNLTKYRIGRDTFRKQIQNVDFYLGEAANSEYIEFFEDLDGNPKKVIRSGVDLNDLETVFNERFGFYIYELYKEFPLVNCHILASKSIQKDRDKMEGIMDSPTCRDSWDHLFKGGEGLYYVFKKLSKTTQKNELFESAKAIEKLFKEYRAAQIKADSIAINEAYETFRSLAFQVGFLMAFDFYMRESDFASVKLASKEFIKRIKGISNEDWVIILTDVKQAYIGNLDPKCWPMFRNLIIRLVQNDKDWYNSSDLMDFSPDIDIVYYDYLRKLKEYAKNELGQTLRETKLVELQKVKTAYLNDSINNMKRIYKKTKCLVPIKMDYKKKCLDFIIEETAKDD